MAARPTPPGVGGGSIYPLISPSVGARAPSAGPPSTTPPTPPASNNKTMELPSLPIPAPTKRPLPLPPSPKIPQPYTPELSTYQEPASINFEMAEPSSPPSRPTPAYFSPLANPTPTNQPFKSPFGRTTSESVTQKAQVLSASLARAATMRSGPATQTEQSRSPSVGSCSSEDSTDEYKRKVDDKKAQEKEAKQRLKDEKGRSKEDEKKDKKDDPKKRIPSASVSSIFSPTVTASMPDSNNPLRGKPILNGLDLEYDSHSQLGSSPASSFSTSSSLGAPSSPLAAAAFDHRKTSVASSKAKKPKQYIQDHASQYYTLIDLLMQNSFLLLRAMETYVKRSDLDRISRDFIAFFSWREITLDYIKSAIRQDVDHAESEGTLFRTNSLLTAIMSNYCQRVGKQYLKNVLGPCVQWLQESTLPFEIDPAQVDNAEVIKQNIFNMNYLANKFFKAILNSNDVIPFEVREIANTLQTAVLKRFPNSKYTAVGGFFFLRFVCPAVLAPENFDFPLSEEHSSTLRRPLVLVAKILQQIANDQKFNEPHMEPLNELISKWTVKVHQFFDLLVKKDTAALHKERDRVLEQMRDSEELERSLLDRVEIPSILSVHRFVSEHVEECVAKFTDKERELGYNPAQELAELFMDMGPPPPDAEKMKLRTQSVATKK